MEVKKNGRPAGQPLSKAEQAQRSAAALNAGRPRIANPSQEALWKRAQRAKKT